MADVSKTTNKYKDIFLKKETHIRVKPKHGEEAK